MRVMAVVKICLLFAFIIQISEPLSIHDQKRGHGELNLSDIEVFDDKAVHGSALEKFCGTLENQNRKPPEDFDHSLIETDIKELVKPRSKKAAGSYPSRDMDEDPRSRRRYGPRGNVDEGRRRSGSRGDVELIPRRSGSRGDVYKIPRRPGSRGNVDDIPRRFGSRGRGFRNNNDRRFLSRGSPGSTHAGRLLDGEGPSDEDPADEDPDDEDPDDEDPDGDSFYSEDYSGRY